MMGFFKAIWGSGKMPRDDKTVRDDELKRTFAEYDRKLEELNEAIHALRGDEPDRREQSYGS